MTVTPNARCVVAIVWAVFAGPAFGQFGTPAITHITGDLYRASSGAWHKIFLVTDDGILVGDTLNTRFAAAFKEEMDSRFPGIPVRYVVHSHSHGDHVEGGEVFGETATLTAHTPEDVTATREYFEYLVGEVDAAIRAGLSLEEAKATVMLEDYAAWAQYERLREKNVEAAYRNLTVYR